MDQPATPHCPHCWGNCPGDCLLPGDTGLCIHKPVRPRPFRERVRLLGNRNTWRRAFLGIR